MTQPASPEPGGSPMRPGSQLLAGSFACVVVIKFTLSSDMSKSAETPCCPGWNMSQATLSNCVGSNRGSIERVIAFAQLGTDTSEYKTQYRFHKPGLAKVL